jgi:hypothetical protein
LPATQGTAFKGDARRTLIMAILAIVTGFAAALLLLEIALRLLPTSDTLETQPVNAAHPYLHFKPDNDVRHSLGWNLQAIHNVHVNNYGFVNDSDYDPGARTPLLMVIGDSYVEALQVPYRETLQAHIAGYAGTRGRVYSVGSSGSALSQYLAYARFARDEFRPGALVVVIVGNDFDESLLEYKSAPGYHYLKRNDRGEFELELVPFEPSPLHILARKSALIWYVHSNGLIRKARGRITDMLSGPDRFVGNTLEQADATRLERSEEAVDHFLAMLPKYAGVVADHIALVVDGIRPELYEGALLKKAEASYFGRMRTYLMQRARELGYLVIDMQPRFVSRNAREGVRFEWSVDLHWNALGHAEAADAVVETGLPEQLFGAPESP